MRSNDELVDPWPYLPKNRLKVYGSNNRYKVVYTLGRVHACDVPWLSWSTLRFLPLSPTPLEKKECTAQQPMQPRKIKGSISNPHLLPYQRSRTKYANNAWPALCVLAEIHTRTMWLYFCCMEESWHIRWGWISIISYVGPHFQKDLPRITGIFSCERTKDFTIKGRIVSGLPYFATPSFVNAVHFSTGKDNLTVNPIFELLSSRAIQNISDMIGYL